MAHWEKLTWTYKIDERDDASICIGYDLNDLDSDQIAKIREVLIKAGGEVSSIIRYGAL